MISIIIILLLILILSIIIKRNDLARYSRKFLQVKRKKYGGALPSEFDGRKEWADLLSPVLDQRSCDSCWAYSTAQAFSDRIRLFSTKGKSNKQLIIERNSIRYDEDDIESTGEPLLRDNVRFDGRMIMDTLSPHYFVACRICDFSEFNLGDFAEQLDSKEYCEMDCGGGYLENAHLYLMLKGLISISKDITPTSYRCSAQREDAYHYKAKGMKFVTVHRHPKTAQQHQENVNAIKNELVRNGPVVLGFDVYTNFHDESGFINNCVYCEPKGKKMFGHAVCCIGWTRKVLNGQETDVWICRNSFGPSFGEQGYFYIKMGSNLCDIESDCWCSIPFDVYETE